MLLPASKKLAIQLTDSLNHQLLGLTIKNTPKLNKKNERSTKCSTGWRRLIGSPKLQIIFHGRATKYRSLLRKMTYKDKGSYESSPTCIFLESRGSQHHWRVPQLSKKSFLVGMARRAMGVRPALKRVDTRILRVARCWCQRHGSSLLPRAAHRIMNVHIWTGEGHMCVSFLCICNVV